MQKAKHAESIDPLSTEPFLTACTLFPTDFNIPDEGLSASRCREATI